MPSSTSRDRRSISESHASAASGSRASSRLASSRRATRALSLAGSARVPERRSLVEGEGMRVSMPSRSRKKQPVRRLRLAFDLGDSGDDLWSGAVPSQSRRGTGDGRIERKGPTLRRSAEMEQVSSGREDRAWIRAGCGERDWRWRESASRTRHALAHGFRGRGQPSRPLAVRKRGRLPSSRSLDPPRRRALCRNASP